MSETAVCEGCGGERKADQWAVHPTEVNLQDGTTRDILFCDITCPDFWDDTEPGEWVALESGEEVQLVDWRCFACDGVYDHGMMLMVIDMDYVDTSEPVAFVRDSTPVCSFCRKKERDRFKTREEINTV
jgi:hypothetical protein